MKRYTGVTDLTTDTGYSEASDGTSLYGSELDSQFGSDDEDDGRSAITGIDDNRSTLTAVDDGRSGIYGARSVISGIHGDGATGPSGPGAGAAGGGSCESGSGLSGGRSVISGIYGERSGATGPSGPGAGASATPSRPPGGPRRGSQHIGGRKNSFMSALKSLQASSPTNRAKKTATDAAAATGAASAPAKGAGAGKKTDKDKYGGHLSTVEQWEKERAAKEAEEKKKKAEAIKNMQSNAIIRMFKEGRELVPIPKPHERRWTGGDEWDEVCAGLPQAELKRNLQQFFKLFDESDIDDLVLNAAHDTRRGRMAKEQSKTRAELEAEREAKKAEEEAKNRKKMTKTERRKAEADAKAEELKKKRKEKALDVVHFMDPASFFVKTIKQLYLHKVEEFADTLFDELAHFDETPPTIVTLVDDDGNETKKEVHDPHFKVYRSQLVEALHGADPHAPRRTVEAWAGAFDDAMAVDDAFAHPGNNRTAWLDARWSPLPPGPAGGPGELEGWKPEKDRAGTVAARRKAFSDAVAARRRAERGAREDRFGDDAKNIAKQLQRKSTPNADTAGKKSLLGGGLARKRSMTMAPARMARMAALAKDAEATPLKRAGSFADMKKAPDRRASDGAEAAFVPPALASLSRDITTADTYGELPGTAGTGYTWTTGSAGETPPGTADTIGTGVSSWTGFGADSSTADEEGGSRPNTAKVAEKFGLAPALPDGDADAEKALPVVADDGDGGDGSDAKPATPKDIMRTKPMLLTPAEAYHKAKRQDAEAAAAAAAARTTMSADLARKEAEAKAAEEEKTSYYAKLVFSEHNKVRASTLVAVLASGRAGPVLFRPTRLWDAKCAPLPPMVAARDKVKRAFNKTKAMLALVRLHAKVQKSDKKFRKKEARKEEKAAKVKAHKEKKRQKMRIKKMKTLVKKGRKTKQKKGKGIVPGKPGSPKQVIKALKRGMSSKNVKRRASKSPRGRSPKRGGSSRRRMGKSSSRAKGMGGKHGRSSRRLKKHSPSRKKLRGSASRRDTSGKGSGSKGGSPKDRGRSSSSGRSSKKLGRRRASSKRLRGSTKQLPKGRRRQDSRAKLQTARSGVFGKMKSAAGKVRGSRALLRKSSSKAVARSSDRRGGGRDHRRGKSGGRHRRSSKRLGKRKGSRYGSKAMLKAVRQAKSRHRLKQNRSGLGLGAGRSSRALLSKRQRSKYGSKALLTTADSRASFVSAASEFTEGGDTVVTGSSDEEAESVAGASVLGTHKLRDMIKKHQQAGNIRNLVNAFGGGRAAKNIAAVAGGSVMAARPQLSPGGMGFGGIPGLLGTPPGSRGGGARFPPVSR